MRRLICVLLIAAAASVSGCGNAGKTEKVLATVNGQPITETMVEEEAKSLPPYVRPILDTPAGRIQFLESLITRDLLVQESLRRGIDRRDDVRERLSMARRSILLEALLREVTEKAPGLSDEALRKYYDTNASSFQVGERVRVSHLLFRDKAKAEDAARRAREGGSFAEMARTAPTEGGTAADLGFIERGSFVKEFEDAAFRAKEGSIVGPVRTTYGFHVIQVGERKSAGIRPFEEVKGQISTDLREQVQREAFETLVAQAKKQAKVQLLIPREPGGPPAGIPQNREKTEAPAAPPSSPKGGR
jgi:peptidyl-prolyl cis-trans isomerase C